MSRLGRAQPFRPLVRAVTQIKRTWTLSASEASGATETTAISATHALTASADSAGATETTTLAHIARLRAAAETAGATETASVAWNVYTPPTPFAPPSTVYRKFFPDRIPDNQPFASTLNASDLWVTRDPATGGAQMLISDGTTWNPIPASLIGAAAALLGNLDVVQTLTAGQLQVKPPQTTQQSSGDPAYGTPGYFTFASPSLNPPGNWVAWRIAGGSPALNAMTSIDLVMNGALADPADAAVPLTLWVCSDQWTGSAHQPNSQVYQLSSTYGAIPPTDGVVSFDTSGIDMTALAGSQDIWFLLTGSQSVGTYQLVYDTSGDSGMMVQTTNWHSAGGPWGYTWAPLPGTPTYVQWTDEAAIVSASAYSQGGTALSAATKAGIGALVQALTAAGVALKVDPGRGTGIRVTDVQNAAQAALYMEPINWLLPGSYGPALLRGDGLLRASALGLVGAQDVDGAQPGMAPTITQITQSNQVISLPSPSEPGTYPDGQTYQTQRLSIIINTAGVSNTTLDATPYYINGVHTLVLPNPYSAAGIWSDGTTYLVLWTR